MNNGNLLNRQYLIHSLHTISAYFNASYNIIHYNCLDSVYSIFDEFDKEATILLRELIEGDDVISLDTKVGERITLGLDPLCNRDRYTKEETLVLEDREDKIQYAIWRIILNFPNPLYQELKHSFKQLKTITRLFYLQMVYRLQNSNQNNYRAYSPVGFLETMQIIETNQSKKDILSIGSIWDRGVLDEKIKDDISLDIKAEKYFFENIIKDRLNGELGWQQKSYLAIQLNSYGIKSPDDIDEMVIKSTAICKELYSLQEKHPNIIEKLEAFEWICVVDIILFVSTDEFKYYIGSFLDSDRERLYVYAPLAIRTSRKFCIKLDISKRDIIFSLEDNNDSSLELDINIRRDSLDN